MFGVPVRNGILESSERDAGAAVPVFHFCPVSNVLCWHGLGMLCLVVWMFVMFRHVCVRSCHASKIACVWPGLVIWTVLASARGEGSLQTVAGDKWQKTLKVGAVAIS